MTEPEKIEDVLAKVRTAIFALCDNPQMDDVGRAVCPCWKCAMCDLGHRIQYVVDALERERATHRQSVLDACYWVLAKFGGGK